MEYLHSMIRVGDLDAALDFFKKLGFIEMNRDDFEEGRYSLVFLAAEKDVERAKQRKTPMLELTYNWDENAYDSGRSFGHLAYHVDDIYALCERLMKQGVTINRPPRDGQMAFVKSPDGISIELLQKGDRLPEKEPWASMKNNGTW